MSPRVLISGAGIAGPVVAFWLAKAGIRATIVERAASLRTHGQHLDIKGVARQIVEDMGLVGAMKAAGTHEAGIHIVDADDRPFASFPVGAQYSAVNEIEVLRGKMVSVFYEATKDTTDYVFDDAIKAIHQDEAGDGPVRVDFENGESREFDVVVLADGIFSKSRSMVFTTERLHMDDMDSTNREATGQPPADISFRFTGFMAAFFPIPWTESDGDWSRWFSALGNKIIWLRPDKVGRQTSAYLLARGTKALELLGDYRSLDAAGQKERWRGLYTGAGWQTKRVMDGMDATTEAPGGDAFYMQEIAQVKARTWHKGRIILVGDAAYCPSPMSGGGALCAITGAYVLGNELARADLSSKEGVERAAEAYERICRPYVEQAQDAPWFIFRMASPETAWGVWFLRWAVMGIWWVTTSRWVKSVASYILPGEPPEKIDLPKYSML